MLYIKENNNLIALTDATLYTECSECGTLIPIIANELPCKQDFINAVEGTMLCGECLSKHPCTNPADKEELMPEENEEGDLEELVGILHEDDAYLIVCNLNDCGFMSYSGRFDSFKEALDYAKGFHALLEDELHRELEFRIAL